MMISVPSRVAFLAMPRAGSTSVERAIEPACDILFKENPRIKHMNFRRYNKHMNAYLNAMKIDNVVTTAVFREPIEWLGSWYRYRARPEMANNAASTMHMDFESFVEGYLQENPPDFAKVGQQSQFVRGPDTVSGIDFLFKFDNLIGLQLFLSEKLAHDLSFVPQNESPKKPLALSPALKARLEQRFETDYHIYRTIAI